MSADLFTKPSYRVFGIHEPKQCFIVAPDPSDWIRHLFLGQLNSIDQIKKQKGEFVTVEREKITKKTELRFNKLSKSIETLERFYSFKKGYIPPEYKKLKESIQTIKFDINEKKLQFESLYSMRAKGIRGSAKSIFFQETLILPWSIAFTKKQYAEVFLQGGAFFPFDFRNELYKKRAFVLDKGIVSSQIWSHLKDSNLFLNKFDFDYRNKKVRVSLGKEVKLSEQQIELFERNQGEMNRVLYARRLAGS